MKTLKVLTMAAIACTLFVGCGEKGTNPTPPTPTTHKLTTSANPAAGGKVSVNGGAASTGTTTTYNAGTQVTVTAAPNTGYKFTGWSGASTSTNASVSVAVNGDITLTANFQLEGTTQPPGGGGPYTLTTSANPSGGGTISVNGTASTGITTHSAGASVTVTASAGSGYTFTGWSGASSATSASVTVTMNSNLTLTANFQPQGGGGPYSLTLNPNPAGGGAVTRNPDKASYTVGDVVVISATPAEGYTFGGWTGGAVASSGSTTTTVTMNANITIMANFIALTYSYSLSTTVNPSNTGAVLRNPEATRYEAGTQVTLTAMSAQGYEFVGWSGASSSTSPSITVTMDGSLSLRANFRILLPEERKGAVTVGGQTYNTVNIGTQWWMAENLNVVTDSSWCYRNSLDSCAKYGRLYAWNAARKACSGIGNGWHLPTREEWKTLVDYAIAGAGSAQSLRSVMAWGLYSGADDYGFSALPGGGCAPAVAKSCADASSFSDGGSGGYWWSASDDDDNDDRAYYRHIYGSLANVLERSGSKRRDGYSVRCIQGN